MEKQAYCIKVSKAHETGISITYELHLVLDAEKLMLRVDTSVGAIRELRDELEARDVRLVMLRELVDEGALDARNRKRKDRLVLLWSVVDTTEGLLAGGDDSDLAEVLTTMT